MFLKTFLASVITIMIYTSFSIGQRLLIDRAFFLYNLICLHDFSDSDVCPVCTLSHDAIPMHCNCLQTYLSLVIVDGQGCTCPVLFIKYVPRKRVD